MHEKRRGTGRNRPGLTRSGTDQRDSVGACARKTAPFERRAAQSGRRPRDVPQAQRAAARACARTAARFLTGRAHDAQGRGEWGDDTRGEVMGRGQQALPERQGSDDAAMSPDKVGLLPENLVLWFFRRLLCRKLDSGRRFTLGSGPLRRSLRCITVGRSYAR